MRFFIDETSFELTAGVDGNTLEQALELLVQAIRARHAGGDDVFRWSKLLEEVEVVPGTPLCDLVYQSSSALSIDRDTRMALQQALNRCVDWDDRFERAPGPQVEMDGATLIARTIAIVHLLNTTGRGACCLALGIRLDRSGVRRVSVGGKEQEVHFVANEDQIPIFYRSLFEIEDLGPDAYMENATRAFPKIRFAPGLAAQFDRFETPYLEVRPYVTKHLSVLNDHFQRVHREKKDKTDNAIGAYGIDASPERGSTHRTRRQ